MKKSGVQRIYMLLILIIVLGIFELELMVNYSQYWIELVGVGCLIIFVACLIVANRNSIQKEYIKAQAEQERKKVEELTSYGFASVDDQTKEEITTIGLSHSMLTPYTSFVAVLDTVRNPQGESAEVDQPSPLPRGVSGLSVGGYLVGTEPEEAMLFGMMVLILAAGLLNRRKRKRSL